MVGKGRRDQQSGGQLTATHDGRDSIKINSSRREKERNNLSDETARRRRMGC